MKAKLDAKSITDSQYSQLFEPVDGAKINDLNNLCDALGITRIEAKEKGWNMLETVAVIAALNRHVKTLEYRGN